MNFVCAGCLLSKEIVCRVSSSNNDSYSFFFCTTQTTSEQVAVKWSWTVVNWVPKVVSTFSMVFTLLFANIVRLGKQEMIDVIIFLEWTFGSNNFSWSTIPDMITHHWLLFIRLVKVFVITTHGVSTTSHLTFFR